MADDLIPNQVVMLVAIIGSLLCIYASSISIVGGVLSIIATVLSAIFGTNTLRKIAKYSLGTGVPSIVYMLTAVGLVSFFVGLTLAMMIRQPVIFPITALAFATVIAYMISLICKYIFDIQVEILPKSFISISIASMLLMISLSSLLAQTYNPLTIYEKVIQNGLIILLMMVTVMIIQNPYNACMGPNEDQYRTLSLSAANSFIMLIVISIISMLYSNYWIVYLIISLIGWFIFFRQYVIYTNHQVASVKRHGLWPTDDGED